MAHLASSSDLLCCLLLKCICKGDYTCEDQLCHSGRAAAAQGDHNGHASGNLCKTFDLKP